MSILNQTTLYLGLEVPLHLRGVVDHYPVIRIAQRSLQRSDILSAFLDFSFYTHVIITSKSAIAIYFSYLSALFPLEIVNACSYIAIGRATAQLLKEYGVKNICVAEEETSEGVIQKLQQMHASMGSEQRKRLFYFWPHSKLSRPIIGDFLKNRELPFTECILYETHLHRSAHVPALENYKEIIFTSPSTVDGFLAIYGRFPEEKIFTCQGKITQEYLLAQQSLRDRLQPQSNEDGFLEKRMH
jgi:uroporphyrinogen-III synthase